MAIFEKARYLSNITSLKLLKESESFTFIVRANYNSVFDFIQEFSSQNLLYLCPQDQPLRDD